METAQHTVFTNPSDKHKHPKLATRKRQEKIILQTTNQPHRVKGKKKKQDIDFIELTGTSETEL